MRPSVKLTGNWQLLLQELGIQPDTLLRRAKLPLSLLAQEQASVSIEGYFQLWEAIEAELPGKPVALLIGKMAALEAFDPAIFAALSSENYNQALKRLQKYKKLIGPFKLDLEIDTTSTRLIINSFDLRPLPSIIGMSELTFFISFIRHATRQHIAPREITVPTLPEFQSQYEQAFDCQIRESEMYSVTFNAEDATRPFLTANETMWKFFEPVLQQRLAAIDLDASTSDRVHAALCELLPSGRGTVQEVSTMLGVSSRSLQRYLKKEQTTFKDVLNATREQLARHYLQRTKLSVGEIAFLLGFDEPNSFFRAFRGWTGTTPQRVRNAFQTA